MNNELAKVPAVAVQKGDIQFRNYEVMLAEATELAELIRMVEVDETSLKTTKKLLAAVNKRVNELEAERIRIKKELLEPYLEFERQVKTITSVVKESDNELRSKVRELEELERQEKRRIVEGLFEKRFRMYPSLFFLTPDKFINPKHLNKTTSLNTVETEMAQWFETVKREWEHLSITAGADLEHYADTLDLLGSLPSNNEPTTVDTPKKVTFTINQDHLIEVTTFLKSSGITYNLKETD